MMTTQPIPTKAELIEALRDSGQQLLSALRALPAAAFERGRYESGWNGRQILAHVASIEWTYPRLLDVARQAGAAPAGGGSGPVRRTTVEEAPGVPTRTAQGGIDAYNERQVTKRADATPDELLAEFERNRAAMVAAVEGTDEQLFTVPIRSAGGITGPLAGVLRAVAVDHVVAHMRDITGY